MRVPNSTPIAPATKSGKATRSSRCSQNSIESRSGSHHIIAAAQTSSGTPMIQSRCRSWMAGSAFRQKVSTSASATARSGATRPGPIGYGCTSPNAASAGPNAIRISRLTATAARTARRRAAWTARRRCARLGDSGRGTTTSWTASSGRSTTLGAVSSATILPFLAPQATCTTSATEVDRTSSQPQEHQSRGIRDEITLGGPRPPRCARENAIPAPFARAVRASGRVSRDPGNRASASGERIPAMGLAPGVAVSCCGSSRACARSARRART